jgi:Ca2+-binding RTX toxin-like protein
VTLDLNLSRGQAQTIVPGQAALALTGTVENVVGSAFGDRIRGNGAANRIHGGAGNDRIYGGSGNDLLFGDDGDDWIYGEIGNKVLVGGEGNDRLFGGTLRSVLIGGAGADEIAGSKGEDILIGGKTSYDANDTALAAILAEWSNTRKSYNARVESLTRGIAGGTISLKRETTVPDDLSPDRLTGGSKTDWRFGFDGDVHGTTTKKAKSA